MEHDTTPQTTISAPEKEGAEQDAHTSLEPIADILARAKDASLQAEELENAREDKPSQGQAPHDQGSKDQGKQDQKSEAQTPDSTSSEETTTKAEDSKTADDSLSHWQDARVKEAEKAERRLADSQKWGREAHGKLKAVESMIGQYLEKGILSDEEAALLLASAQHPDPVPEQQDEPLLVRYGTVWDRELSNMRKYANSPDLDLHIEAFQHFLKNGSPAEVMEIFTQLKALEHDDVAFTRHMLEMGKSYYAEVYKDIHTAGSLKDYKTKKDQEIQKHLRHIDKLEKEIIKLKEQYEDYLPSKSYRLPHGGSAESPKDSDSSIGSILDRAKMGNLNRR